MQFYHDSKTMAALALPMIVSNISVPLVGLVDTAIVGHLAGAQNLAGVALGSIVITQLIWICGFLRMSTTGFSAQAVGSEDQKASARVLIDGVIAALFISLMVLILQQTIFGLALDVSKPTEATAGVATQYFGIRVNFVLVPLVNLVLIGWMIGQQLHKQVMTIQVLANVCNILLSLLLAIQLDMGVTGVAIATVFSEILVLLLSVFVINKNSPNLLANYQWNVSHMKSLLGANQAMFIRNIILQFCLAVITFSGIRFGELTAATNAVLMQFFVLIALGLDGIAYAAEALIGKTVGARKQDELIRWLQICTFWSLIVACTYSIIFLLGFDFIGSLITDMPEIQQNMIQFKWYIILLPIVGHWCFLLDGIYIGLMKAKAMRDTMFFSALFIFLPSWWLLLDLNNHGLWVSFLLFLGARGLLLGIHLNQLSKRSMLFGA